jgi:dihydropteroate synthase
MVQLVGILNVTPDSFSDGGQFFQPDLAIVQAEELLRNGASLLDIGAESTRPQAVPLGPEEEWRRLYTVLETLLTRHPGKISLDSYHPETIRRALAIGPVIINDVTGFNNAAMRKVALEYSATVIISHLPDMSIAEAHRLAPVSMVEQVKHDLLLRASQLQAGGLSQDQIILDPGIGFGKTMELNRALLGFAAQVLAYRVMIGYSRKRFLGANRLSLAPNLAAGRTAASYLRVHDVAGHKPLLDDGFQL